MASRGAGLLLLEALKRAARAGTRPPALWQPAGWLAPPVQPAAAFSTLPSLTAWAAAGGGGGGAAGAPPRPRLLSSLPPGVAGITPALEVQLVRIAARHADLLRELGGGEVAHMAPADIARLSKELSDLSPVVEAAARLRSIKDEMEELRSLAEGVGEDEEVREMAREEREGLQGQLPSLEGELIAALVPRDAADERGVVLEVRAGTGGDEACLFAMDLFRMYERYAALHGWRFEAVELGETDIGGVKMASAVITGHGAYGRLKFESGIHRVQRVPATESGGRVHTSAASVAVLPEAGDVDVAVREEDLRIDVYRAGGAGGQHVNTTNSAVRVTHVPSGLVVAIQDERSQHKNKAKALKVLRARLFERQQALQRRSQSAERKQQIGSGDRSERIRTYNFPQGRVTDHRVGVTEHGIEAVLLGERLDALLEAVRLQAQSEALASLGDAAPP